MNGLIRLLQFFSALVRLVADVGRLLDWFSRMGWV